MASELEYSVPCLFMCLGNDHLSVRHKIGDYVELLVDRQTIPEDFAENINNCCYRDDLVI